MKKPQLILAVIGVIVMAVLWFFGSTVNPKGKEQPAVEMTKQSIPSFNIDNFIKESKQKLEPYQADYINKIENSISRGDVKTQQEKAYSQLANFWADTMKNVELYVFYLSKATMLVNSEKNLTFAARQILAAAKNEPEAAKRGWKAEQAISLFQKAIELNPENDSLKIGLGACYVYGKGMAGDATETMKGIQQLLQVVRKDSTNMQAQMVLGIGGVVSTQYAKAVERLLKVVAAESKNIEAVGWLAEAYAGKGDKVNAVKWFEESKKLMNNAVYSREIDERIKQLK